MGLEIFHKVQQPPRTGEKAGILWLLSTRSQLPSSVSTKGNDSLARASQSQCAKASPQTRLPPLRGCLQVETWSLNDRNDQNMQTEKRSINKYTL